MLHNLSINRLIQPIDTSFKKKRYREKQLIIGFYPTITIEFYSSVNRTTTEEADARKKVIIHTWIGSFGKKIGSFAPKSGSK